MPVRIEVGPKDLAKNQVVLVRRDNRAKQFVPREGAADALTQTLETMQKDLYAKALAFRDSKTQPVDEYRAFRSYMDEDLGFATAHWCGDAACEARVKEETKATIRTVPEGDMLREEGRCIVCGAPSDRRVIWAKAY